MGTAVEVAHHEVLGKADRGRPGVGPELTEQPDALALEQRLVADALLVHVGVGPGDEIVPHPVGLTAGILDDGACSLTRRVEFSPPVLARRFRLGPRCSRVVERRPDPLAPSRERLSERWEAEPQERRKEQDERRRRPNQLVPGREDSVGGLLTSLRRFAALEELDALLGGMTDRGFARRGALSGGRQRRRDADEEDDGSEEQTPAMHRESPWDEGGMNCDSV